ncbi:MAG: DJ-1/PfpI family protein [Caulobacteraceae bacterium]|nr:DJ-1/PfpI family protein [Caulobacteraceae bacterium]
MQRAFDILFVLYPGFTQLDFAGPYEVFCRIPGARVRLASPEGGDLRTEHGLTYRDIERLADIDRCDLICVPGGADPSPVMRPDILAQITRLAAGSRFTTSVCNGSLVLGAAGLLKGRRAACHWAMRHLLADYGATPDDSRVVRDGEVITGGGVTAGIDFALTCAAEIADKMVAQAIQLLIEYAPAPPFDSGRPEIAAPGVMDAFQKLVGGDQSRV